MKDWRMSWAECEKLAFKVALNVKKSGFKPDFIVCISRGGLLPGRLLSDYLGVPLAVVTAKSYAGRKKNSLSYRLHFSSLTPVEGEVLLVDDVADSGNTLHAITARLKKNYKVKGLKTATLVEKSFSSFKPDFTGSKYDGWIVFPYEKRLLVGSYSAKKK